MKKIIVAATAAFALALAPLTSATALDVTVSGTTWGLAYDYFGVGDVKDDAYDGTEFGLSLDGGASFVNYGCRTEGLFTETVLTLGKIATCNELVTVQPGLNVRGYSFVYPDGLLAAVTYEIKTTTASSISFKWQSHHEYGEGFINDVSWDDIWSRSDGTDYETSPAAVAWGPTNQACSAAEGEDDGYDAMEVESESCSLAAGATTAITIFHLLDDNDSNSDLAGIATGFFTTRSFDSTLAAGIPSGLVASNWGLTGTLNVTTIPAAADPYDGTSMTLTGDAVLGSDMTVAFKNGEDPVGDYYDVWMCPNKDVKPIDEVNEGDCIAVTFWNRGVVANYDQATSAKTMTWLLSNDSEPGLIAQGGASYLDSSGDPINMDPPTDDDGWCAYEGWYMIVQDYIEADVPQTGGHSNWSPALGAAGCSEPAAGLANTGADVQQTGLIGLFALLAGLGVVVARRRAVRSN
jgi:LPXTG-motif cell wall-anchored protein